MAKIWVFIAPSVVANGQGAKSALSNTLKDSITKSLTKQTQKALPDDTFTTKDTDKPPASTDAYNAIKVSPELTLTVDTKGSLLSVGCTLKLIFEAIKIPNLKNGNLLASASKGATVERRGSGERAIASQVDEGLDNILALALKQVISQPRFKSYGKSLGLPL